MNRRLFPVFRHRCTHTATSSKILNHFICVAVNLAGERKKLWTANIAANMKSHPHGVDRRRQQTAEFMFMTEKCVLFKFLESERETRNSFSFGVEATKCVEHVPPFLSFRIISLRKTHKFCLSIKTSRREWKKESTRKCHVKRDDISCCFGIFRLHSIWECGRERVRDLVTTTQIS